MIGVLIVTAVAIVGGFALLSPLESLLWWGRRRDRAVLDSLARPDRASGETSQPATARPAQPSPSDSEGTQPRMYAVYLSGIASVDGSSDSRREQAMLQELAEQLPDVVFTSDVFPYAANGRALSQRRSTWFWRGLQRTQKLPVVKAPSYLINLRNLFKVLVSTDPRYGPTYNLAVAQQIVGSLTAHGYDWSRPVPVAVIGYSGGGQIALGASWFLAALKVPVTVVSLGGVLCADPALDRVVKVHQFYGTKDNVQSLGRLVFPGRWFTAAMSPWFRARRAGKIITRQIGPMKHMGKRDYFDRHAKDGDGRTFRSLTVDAIAAALK